MFSVARRSALGFQNRISACTTRKFSVQYHYASNINDAKLSLYGAKYSQPTRSVLLLLKELNIPFQLFVTDPLKGDTRTPEFRKINPDGKIPCLRVSSASNPDESFVLGESSAILQYICNTYALNNYYPLNPVERAQVDFWLAWHHSNSRVCTTKILLPAIFKSDKSEELIAGGQRSLAKSLKLMDTHLASTKQQFLASDNMITIADLLILPELDQHLPDGYDMMNNYASYPYIQQWIKNCANALPISYETNYNEVKHFAENFKNKNKNKKSD